MFLSIAKVLLAISLLFLLLTLIDDCVGEATSHLWQPENYRTRTA